MRNKLTERVNAKRPTFQHEINDIFEVLPTVTNKNARIVQVEDQAIQEILNVRPEYVISPRTYDQKHIDRIRQVKNCIAYGAATL